MGLIYNAVLEGMARGSASFDSVKVLLVTSAYKPSKDHKRSDIKNEVSGAGYVKGGKAVEVSIIKNANSVDITLGGTEWPSATINAAGAVYYGDDLIAFIDFGEDIISKKGKFVLTESVLTLQNG